ncbi:MAG: glycosyltransferase [Actinomycetota bacterium]|nr:glycosyltransferase [Actinomycetota bacterium]MDP2287410.1 glycosyltransferase [Actinomycetota bacterium]
MTVAVVVPTFRPDSASLMALIAGLQAAGLPVLVSDDASPVTFDPVLREVGQLGVDVVRHQRNEGIARGLNDGLAFAEEQGATWLLTVDQDTALPAGYVESVLPWARDGVGVVAAEHIDDASGRLSYPTQHSDGFMTTHEVIQTGSLWSITDMRAVGGFDESLGIDAVDAAACLRLRERGLRVVLAPGVCLSHHLGSARQIRILGRTVLATGHSPGRRTTMVRNRLKLAPAEFRQSPIHALRTLRRVAVNLTLGLIVEDDRWAKAKAGLQGLRPGTRQ